MMPSVSILIPTHNRVEILAQTLRSLSAVTVPPAAEVELVVVANGCTDATSDVCAGLFRDFPFAARCVDEPKLGASCARNRAVAESTGEICAFLDDDVLLAEDWLCELLRAFEQPSADIVAGRVDLAWEGERPEWLTRRFESFLSANCLGEEARELHDFAGVVGANFSFRRKVAEGCGAFQSHIGRIGGGMMAFDESEFVVRAMRAGFRLFYAPGVRVEHWTPRERACPEYICRAAAGFAQGRVLAKERFGPAAAMRCLAGHGYLFCLWGVRELLSLRTGDRERILSNRVWRVTGQAGFRAGMRRCLGLAERFAARSTAGPEPVRSQRVEEPSAVAHQ